KVFKADLVLVVPLQLNAVAGGSNIDVTGYLGGLAGDDLLGFTKDMGDMAVSFNTLTLNIGLTGALMEEGELVITIDGRDDPISFDFNSNDISIALGPYLGPSQNFTIQKIELHIEKGGGLKIPRGLSLLSVGVKAGVDAVLEL
ncbi:MAG: hypothetical protein LBB98_11740, partial [Treponema sp.]|nr:hypothetical protein [Treponema sp.]